MSKDIQQDGFQWICDEGGLAPIISKIQAALCASRRPFILWLEGEMGAGKTSFVRHFLQALGLPSSYPVVSPTYTLVNEYQIGDDWYAHLDLYRAEENFSFEELGIQDIRDHLGFFVEWPSQGDAGDFLPATHRLKITSIDEGQKRKYEFSVV